MDSSPNTNIVGLVLRAAGRIALYLVGKVLELLAELLIPEGLVFIIAWVVGTTIYWLKH